MSDEKKESLISITWKEILSGVIGLIILGAVTFVFTNFSERLASVEEASSKRDTDYQTTVVNTINNVKETTDRMSTDLTNISNKLTETREDVAWLKGKQR